MKRSGYSLTEMLVVLAILATLSGILFSAYTRFQKNTRVATNADKVASTLAMARSLAISGNTIYHVRLEHWDAENGKPLSEPGLTVFYYTKFNDALKAQADPTGTPYQWNHYTTLYTNEEQKDASGNTLKDENGNPIMIEKRREFTTGSGTHVYNNYVVEKVKLDRGVFLGQHFVGAVASFSDSLQNNIISFSPDGTAIQTNRLGLYLVYVTDVEALARQITNHDARRAAYNEESGSKYQKSNVVMVEVLPGGIIRRRKGTLPEPDE